jgi:hypothetical protein
MVSLRLGSENPGGLLGRVAEMGTIAYVLISRQLILRNRLIDFGNGLIQFGLGYVLSLELLLHFEQLQHVRLLLLQRKILRIQPGTDQSQLILSVMLARPPVD